MLFKTLKELCAKIVCLLVIILVVNLSVFAQSSEIIYLEWIDDPTTTAVINWISTSGSNETLEYRENGNNWKSVNSSVNSIPGTSSNRFKTLLTDLDSGSVYEFRVAGNPTTYSFRTAPDSIDEPMRFIVAGDVYTDAIGPLKDRTIDAFINMSENASEYDPYFAALGGDLAHAGSSADDVELWFDFLQLWQEHMITSEGHLIPMVISIGNNEVPGGFGADPEDLVFINALFSFPKDQWGNSSFNHYGVLDFSDYLSIIMLNTNHSNQIEGAQTSWLSNQLRNRRNVDHIFPVYHVAGWPTHRTFRGVNEDAVRNNWHNLFYQNDIRVAFEHHDHIFKRTRALGGCNLPINNQSDCNFDPLGVIYMGGGSWASPNQRDFRSNDWYLNDVSRDHNFVMVEITHARRTFRAIGESSQEITGFTDYIKVYPPDELVVTDVSTDSFTAEWSESEGANKYFIDLAYDRDFQNYVIGFEDKNRGGSTEFSLDDLEKNQTYYLRVRSENFFDLSDSSEPLEIVLIPEAPAALPASDITVTSFTANWGSVPSASNYLLDVSTDSTFSSHLPGFQQRDVGDVSSFEVTNILPGTSYFYRLRAQKPPQASDYSETVTAQTIGIDFDNSNLNVDLNRILANNEQVSTLTFQLIGEEGQPLENVPVAINQDGGESTLTPESSLTDEDGIVSYSVVGNSEGVVTYQATIAGIEVGNSVSVEFQPFLDSAEIGHNFPNPFRNQTNIPLTIPRRMHVHLSLVSIVGANVQVLMDEELSAGYFEIPFVPSGLASGLYFLRLVTEDGVSLNKMTYMK